MGFSLKRCPLLPPVLPFLPTVNHHNTMSRSRCLQWMCSSFLHWYSMFSNVFPIFSNVLQCSTMNVFQLSPLKTNVFQCVSNRLQCSPMFYIPASTGNDASSMMLTSRSMCAVVNREGCSSTNTGFAREDLKPRLTSSDTIFNLQENACVWGLENIGKHWGNNDGRRTMKNVWEALEDWASYKKATSK